MLQELDKGTRKFIEDEAIKLQRILKIQNKPNEYDFFAIKKFFGSKRWTFLFNSKIVNPINSMNGTSLENAIEQMINYNVVETKDTKILRFDIKSPSYMINKFEYIMFLRAIFYEYWGELKENTHLKEKTFQDNADYNLFSRAMIIPYKELNKVLNQNKKCKIADIADSFFVLYGVIEERIKDYNYLNS